MNRCRHIGNTHTGRCRRSRGYSFKFRILAVIFNIIDDGFESIEQLFRFCGIKIPVWATGTLFQILSPDFRDSLTKAHSKSLNQLLTIIRTFRIAWITIPAFTRSIYTIFCRSFNIFFRQSLTEETHTAFLITIVSIPNRNNDFATTYPHIPTIIIAIPEFIIGILAHHFFFMRWDMGIILIKWQVKISPKATAIVEKFTFSIFIVISLRCRRPEILVCRCIRAMFDGAVVV